MEERPFSEEVALRIALAARVLPDIDIPDLIEILEGSVGTPLTVEALRKVTVTHLKTGYARTYDLDNVEDDGGAENPRTRDMADYKEAVRILWGEVDSIAAPPVAAPATPAPAPSYVRVAVASNHGEQLDGHFGSCLRFLIYDLSPSDLRLVDSRDTAEADATHDKNSERVKLIEDCCVMYCVSIGGPAAAKVIRARIHIVPTPSGGPAPEVLANLQKTMVSAPPPWLAKLLGVAPGARLRNYSAATEA